MIIIGFAVALIYCLFLQSLDGLPDLLDAILAIWDPGALFLVLQRGAAYCDGGDGDEDDEEDATIVELV